MDWDDVRPKPDRVAGIGEDLSRLSIGDLEARIGALAAEIERVKAALAAKREHERRAADLFKR